MTGPGLDTIQVNYFPIFVGFFQFNNLIDDSRVKVNLLPGSFSASKVSPYDSESMSFQIIVNSANEIFPNAHITPGKYL